MRKKGVIFLLIVLALILAVVFLLSDRLLENQMESAGTNMAGALVEFDGVDFSLLDLSIKWDRLQVTDAKNTWYNVLETGPVKFALNPEALMYKKIVIESLQLDSLRFNTRREKDGALPEKEAESEEGSALFGSLKRHLKQETDQMPVFNLNRYGKKINVDSLWKMADLHTPHRIDSLKTAYQQTYSLWEKRLGELPTQKDLDQYQKRLETIKPDQIKTIAEFQVALGNARDIYKSVDSLSKNLKQVKSDFQVDLKQLRDSHSQISGWISEDYQKSLSMAHLPDVSVKNAARVLFGQRIIGLIDKISGYIGTVRYYASKLQSGKPEKESPPRFAGQDIHFSSRTHWPSFWIKTVDLSARVWKDLQLSGNIRNIVSEQKIIGEPTTLKLSGQRRDGAAVSINGLLNYLTDQRSEKLDLRLSGIPLRDVKLTDFALLPYKLKKGVGEVQADIEFREKDFQSDIRFQSREVQFDYSQKPTGLNPRLTEISRSIAQSVNNISFEAKAIQQSDNFSFSLNSNLDNLIADQMKKILSGEVAKARDELKRRVMGEAEKYRAELDKLVAEKETKLKKQLARVEAGIEKQKKQIDEKQKEIEKRIADKKNKAKKKLEDEARKKLKNIFK